MKIKIQCPCETRFEFEIEPVDGRMPVAIQCPGCGAERTEEANEIIRAAAGDSPPPAPTPPAATRLRVSGGGNEPAAAPAEASEKPDQAPADPVPVPHRPAPVSYAPQKAGGHKLAYAGGILAAFLLGFWIWYAFFGSKPKEVFALTYSDNKVHSYSTLLSPEQVLFIDEKQAALHSIADQQVLWSVSLNGSGGAYPTWRRPLEFLNDEYWSELQVYCAPDEVMIGMPDRIARIDRRNGSRKDDLPIQQPSYVIQLSGQSGYALSGGVPGELVLSRLGLVPAGVDRTSLKMQGLSPGTIARLRADHGQVDFSELKAAAYEPREFIPAGPNIAQIRVRMLEGRTAVHQAIRPVENSVLNGGIVSGANRAAAEREMMNEMRRDGTRGVEREDVSLYEVTVRRIAPDTGQEWKGQVTGQVRFFPMRTVDVLTAGRSVHLFSKQNRKLWESLLSEPILDRFLHDETGLVAPCVEYGNTLYFFDRGSVTAFELQTGKVIWRADAVGVREAWVDGRGDLYICGSTASVEALQYSQDVEFDNAKPMLSKLKGTSGEVLWDRPDMGDACILTGNFLYATRARFSNLEAAFGKENSMPVHFRIYRVDPKNGKVLWEQYYKAKAPYKVEAQRNTLLLQFHDKVQILRFMAL